MFRTGLVWQDSPTALALQVRRTDRVLNVNLSCLTSKRLPFSVPTKLESLEHRCSYSAVEYAPALCFRMYFQKDAVSMNVSWTCGNFSGTLQAFGECRCQFCQVESSSFFESIILPSAGLGRCPRFLRIRAMPLHRTTPAGNPKCQLVSRSSSEFDTAHSLMVL
jgi:hypothetical protein